MYMSHTSSIQASIGGLSYHSDWDTICQSRRQNHEQSHRASIIVESSDLVGASGRGEAGRHVSSLKLFQPSLLWIAFTNSGWWVPQSFLPYILNKQKTMGL